MVEYVAGFLFDDQRQLVALIQKNKPEDQAGKWNGVGGKIETTDASPQAAMSREFLEETGVETKPEDWQHYTTLSDGTTFKVYFLRAFASYDKVLTVRTTTDEVVQTFWVHSLPTPVMTNLKWLIHMALSMDNEQAESFEVKEQGKKKPKTK